MRFSSRQDIAASLDEIFAMLTEFDAIEKGARRRRIAVRRIAPEPGGNKPGGRPAWDVGFRLHGGERRARLELAECDVHRGVCLRGEVEGIETVLRLDLIPLSRHLTRIAVTADLSPRTIPARLLVQSLRLVRGKLDRSFACKVEEYAALMEQRALDSRGARFHWRSGAAG